MSPAGLKNGVVDALVKASPEVLFLAFGRRSILSSATMWQAILYPPIFVRILDLSLSFLFDWQGKNISLDQKVCYPFLDIKYIEKYMMLIDFTARCIPPFVLIHQHKERGALVPNHKEQMLPDVR